ncbi:MAG: 3-phosphoglycerate dehydrogenase [Gammaproteobacteria bacterium]|nr:3-phosphoglycerate dehydrogenase [Gammaproteobacteria bacterium]
MFKIQTLNTIAVAGLNLFPREYYEIASDIKNPNAILVRSHAMHEMTIPASTQVVGRAGAGLNNIPVAALTKRGIPVLNTPGANANAVRELVMAGMLLASRNIPQALNYVTSLATNNNLEQMIEQHKKQFVGFELLGKTLGVIGLGNVGVRVANAAMSFGMKVIGYDPSITVNHAWMLSSEVKKARSIDDLVMEADFITFHVPLMPATKHLLNAARFNLMKKGIVLLNFSRMGIIDEEALVDALNEDKVHIYVTDFPTEILRNHPRVISLPHLGASTKEAEENCAMMLANQIREFLENGSITNAANFPSLSVPTLSTPARLAIVNANIPNMVAQISAKLAAARLNIVSLLNQSREDIAYTVIDLALPINQETLDEIAKIAGILQLRVMTHHQTQ